MKIWRGVAIGVVAAALTTSAVIARMVDLAEQQQELAAQIAWTDRLADAAERRGLWLHAQVEAAEQAAPVIAALAASRPAFDDVIAQAAAALTSAQGKADVDAARAAIHAAQSAVLAERKNPATVATATATVSAIVASLNGDAAAFDAATAGSTHAGGAGGGPGASGFDRVRRALDRVGGAGVPLYESGGCAGGDAPACANSEGYIKYRADLADWPEDRLLWAMAHELAHIHQFRVWGDLSASDAYAQLFSDDPEFLANCMAAVRGYPGSVGCDSVQQGWAASIWVGVVG